MVPRDGAKRIFDRGRQFGKPLLDRVSQPVAKLIGFVAGIRFRHPPS
jgi:hypothetical protein